MGNILSSSTPRGVLLRHKQRLEDMIESRFELTGQLATSDVLGYREIAELRAISSVYQRNASLLDLIANKPPSAYEHFMTALELTGQKHVANFIANNGELCSVADDDNWPLEQCVLARIYHNLLFLEETVETEGGLLADLLARGVVTRQQFDYINETRPSQKAAELVNILTRRSFAHLKLFIDCLHANRQSHVARILEEGGVVLSIDLQLELPADSNITALTAQTDILHRVQQQCGASSLDRYQVRAFDDLTREGIEVVDARPGSVRLYMWCRYADAMVTHKQMCDNGQMKTLFETWFTDILQSPVSLKLTERQGDLAQRSSADTCSSSAGIWSRMTRVKPSIIAQKQMFEPSLFENLYSLMGVDVDETKSTAANGASRRPVKTSSSFVLVSSDFDRSISSSCSSPCESLGASSCSLRRSKGFFSFS